MKKRVIHMRNLDTVFAVFVLFSLGLCPMAKAQLNISPQQLDTIYVSETQTSSIIFPEAISLVDLGSNAFQAATHDKVLLLKAEKDSYGILPTTLFVRFGSGGYFQGFVAYHPKPKEPFYDWRRMKSVLPGTETSSNKNQKTAMAALSPLDTLMVYAQTGLHYMKGLDREYVSIGKIAHLMELSLVNVRHDRHFSYIKLTLRNHSSLPYHVSYLGLQLREPVKKKSLQDMVSPISPTLQEVPSLIQPLEEEDIYLVFAHKPSPKKAFLEISIREKKGSRALSLSIEAKVLLQAKIFQNP